MGFAEGQFTLCAIVLDVDDELLMAPELGDGHGDAAVVDPDVV